MNSEKEENATFSLLYNLLHLPIAFVGRGILGRLGVDRGQRDWTGGERKDLNNDPKTASAVFAIGAYE